MKRSDGASTSSRSQGSAVEKVAHTGHAENAWSEYIRNMLWRDHALWRLVGCRVGMPYRHGRRGRCGVVDAIISCVGATRSWRNVFSPSANQTTTCMGHAGADCAIYIAAPPRAPSERAASLGIRGPRFSVGHHLDGFDRSHFCSRDVIGGARESLRGDDDLFARSLFRYFSRLLRSRFWVTCTFK